MLLERADRTTPLNSLARNLTNEKNSQVGRGIDRETIRYMLLPSSRTTRSARCKISVRVLAMIDVEKVRGLDPSSVGRVEHP